MECAAATVIDDNLVESFDEEFNVTLEISTASVTLCPISSAIVTISDDESKYYFVLVNRWLTMCVHVYKHYLIINSQLLCYDTHANSHV